MSIRIVIAIPGPLGELAARSLQKAIQRVERERALMHSVPQAANRLAACGAHLRQGWATLNELEALVATLVWDAQFAADQALEWARQYAEFKTRLEELGGVAPNHQLVTDCTLSRRLSMMHMDRSTVCSGLADCFTAIVEATAAAADEPGDSPEDGA